MVLNNTWTIHASTHISPSQLYLQIRVTTPSLLMLKSLVFVAKSAMVWISILSLLGSVGASGRTPPACNAMAFSTEVADAMSLLQKGTLHWYTLWCRQWDHQAWQASSYDQGQKRGRFLLYCMQDHLSVLLGAPCKAALAGKVHARWMTLQMILWIRWS